MNPSTLNPIYMFFYPDMDRIEKLTVDYDIANPNYRAVFAIGVTHPENSSMEQTHIMVLENSAMGIGEFGAYPFATPDIKEHIDDLALVDDYIVYATRDSRDDHSMVNLRLSKTSNILLSTEIDMQWQFVLGAGEVVYGKVFVIQLRNYFFEVCYVKYVPATNCYVLCLHRIFLYDLLNGINSAVSQEIPVERGELIQDITYELEKEVLVVLLDKDENSSVFLHTNPNKMTPYSTVRLETRALERYFSIDTVNHIYMGPNPMYQAWGGNRRFMQSFTTMGAIGPTCLDYSTVMALVVNPIKIIQDKVPLVRDEGTRNYHYDTESLYSTPGLSTCITSDRDE